MINKKGEILGEQHEGTIPTEKKLQNERKKTYRNRTKGKSQQNETIERKERNIYITQREQQDYVSPYGTTLVRAITLV